MTELVRYPYAGVNGGWKQLSLNQSEAAQSTEAECQSVLNGCIVFVSSKLKSLVPELCLIAEHLGAEIAPKFDPKIITHLVHQSSRTSETFREFRLARSANIPIVHPQWLFECRSQGKRCLESEWMWTWNAEKSLAVVVADSASAPDGRRERRQRQDENTPPKQRSYPVESVKVEELAKLIGSVSSPQKGVKRKLTGRAKDTPISNSVSSVKSSEIVLVQENEAPRATQEKVEYKDPVAEREMAKLIANLQGIPEDESLEKPQPNEMTPAEDSWRVGGRRKSARK
jgi:hypothetical protein